jgi:hypothetical protein
MTRTTILTLALLLSLSSSPTIAIAQSQSAAEIASVMDVLRLSADMTQGEWLEQLKDLGLSREGRDTGDWWRADRADGTVRAVGFFHPDDHLLVVQFLPTKRVVAPEVLTWLLGGEAGGVKGDGGDRLLVSLPTQTTTTPEGDTHVSREWTVTASGELIRTVLSVKWERRGASSSR